MVLLLMVLLLLLLRVATIFWRNARDALATHSASSRLLLLRMMVMVVRFLRGVYTPLTADPSLARLLCRYRRERLHGCNLCLRVPPHRLLRAAWPLAIKGLRKDLSLRGAVAAWSLRSKWLGLEAVNGRRRPGARCYDCVIDRNSRTCSARVYCRTDLCPIGTNTGAPTPPPTNPLPPQAGGEIGLCCRTTGEGTCGQSVKNTFFQLF